MENTPCVGYLFPNFYFLPGHALVLRSAPLSCPSDQDRVVDGFFSGTTPTCISSRPFIPHPHQHISSFPMNSNPNGGRKSDLVGGGGTRGAGGACRQRPRSHGEGGDHGLARRSRGEGRRPWEDVVVRVGKIAHPCSRGDGHGDDGSRGGGVGQHRFVMEQSDWIPIILSLQFIVSPMFFRSCYSAIMYGSADSLDFFSSLIFVSP
jgi:hypothetical protein